VALAIAIGSRRKTEAPSFLAGDVTSTMRAAVADVVLIMGTDGDLDGDADALVKVLAAIPAARDAMRRTV
jgi:hypothetical protein